MAERIIELGCGPAKTPGAFGVDIFPYQGVDRIQDLDQIPWSLPDGSFDRVIARHIIEHVERADLFMKEVHRIAAHGALLEVVTPHYSFVHSWSDPTHRRHLSTQWYLPFLAGGYLAEQVGAFERVSSTVTFGSSVRCWIPKLMIRLRGLDRWEKHYAFVYPARDILTTLRVVKRP
ncbi:MAG: class I SAM-dependent methyltransferase [Acidobacteriia bacterium]|nr:class I SAM-dependent methyltransferase [Terriglobia bacterium]